MSDTVKLNPCPKCGAPIPAEAPQGLCPKCVLVGAATATEAGLPATATAEIPSLERVAAAFPQLEILELLGRGGMGFVFKARQPHLDRFVALKLLPDKLARDPRFAERFNREGRVLAKLNHPNIVSVYDFGQTEHFYFLLMELVDGVNLRQAMKAGRFSPGEALAIVPKICEALQYAHGQGILHRDIKPENILLDARGQVKIADFGIAKLVGEEKPDVALTATGASLGTPHYMAPEQLEHPLTVDHRADIYSLGVVFYEMLTGELPIGRFAAPSSKTPVGTAVDEVVFRTLEKDRERRYQSAGEVKTQVEHLAESDAAGTPPALSQAVPAHPTHTHWARIAGWVAVGLLLLNFLGPHLTRLGNSPANTFTIGLTTPWYVNLPRVDEHGVITREVRYNFHSSAFYSGVFGLLLCIGLLATRRSASKAAPGPGALQAGALPAVPAWSHKAIWGAVLTGLSLPLPTLMAVLVYLGAGGLAGVELLLGAGAIGLPGLVGTILGWMALSDIRAHQGRLRGLPLAVFAALAYPLLMLVAATLVIPWVLTKRSGGPGTGMPLLGLLVLLIPLGTITFGIWTVFAAARWGANKSPTRRRGVLKWVFLGMLFAVTGVVAGLNFLQGRASEETREEPSPSFGRISSEPAETTPWIRFTFTAVELRELAGVRWLAIDYVDDVHGDCQKAFPWEATIPGFKAATRTSAFLKQDQGSPQVRHQRIEYRMPDSASREQLDKLRENLEQRLIQKSMRLELGDHQAPVLLFELPGADGGSLKAWVKVVPPLNSSATQQARSLGTARLVAAQGHQHVAIARIESLPGHPLHQIVARFAGPTIPDRSRPVSGPLLVPSPDEDMGTDAEPVDGSITWSWGTSSTQVVASAVSFECPGDYSFQFVLPDESLAREAARQMKEALAQPVSLVPGAQVQLFTAGQWKGWLETRPFVPAPDKFTFFRHPGLAPVQIPGTNLIDSAVATIPPGHELKVAGRVMVNGVNRPELGFSTTLTSGPNEAGFYWFTWYGLPNPQGVDNPPKENWEFQIHDTAGSQLYRSQAPKSLKNDWRRRYLGEPISVRAGKPITQMIFEKPNSAADRGPTTVFLEMTMQRSTPMSSLQGSLK